MIPYTVGRIRGIITVSWLYRINALMTNSGVSVDISNYVYI